MNNCSSNPDSEALAQLEILPTDGTENTDKCF